MPAVLIPYTVFGYEGKQVRDNLHSHDYVWAIDAFYFAPRPGEVDTMGGGSFCSCSVLEAIALREEMAGRRLAWRYIEENRPGDHVWWITDTGKFARRCPQWAPKYDVRAMLEQMPTSPEVRQP